MLIEEALDLATTLTRAQLRERLPGLWLAIGTGTDPIELGFRTEKAPMGGQPRDHGIEQILQIAKAPGNPYPERISIGRTRNCDIVLRDPSVSKLHANFFESRPERIEVADLGSQNGTLHNGLRMRPHTAEAVHVGDTLILGRVSTSVLDADALFELARRSGSPL